MFMKAILILISSVILSYGGELDKSGSQWYPFLEWKLVNSSYSGNPFDVIATATFTHKGSGETHVTEMFYDGDNTWKFRFTGTLTGTWEFTTESDDPDLDSKSGIVSITPNLNPKAYGFLTHFGNKWGWQGTSSAFVPQLVMYVNPRELYYHPDRIEKDVHNWLVEHGFTGLHTGVIGGRWFNVTKNDDRVSPDMEEPDPRTFRILEELIVKVHRAGGMVHIWQWGDASRSQTADFLKGGKYGEIDRRLLRYIAARLGPLPGWSMGYGYDLDEYLSLAQLNAWRDYLQLHCGWSHYFGGRPYGPNRGSNHSPFNNWNKNMDYASYEHHQPSYNVYVAALKANPNKPVMSEDRFRIRIPSKYPDKDYTDEMTKSGLYISTMAGGVANIWGTRYNYGDWTPGGGSHDYKIKEQIKTYSQFSQNRFLKDMQRDNNITDGYCLRSGQKHFIFYKENTYSIKMNLTEMDGPQPAVAVNTLKPYSEISLGTLEPDNKTIDLGITSDWVVAVGDFTSGDTMAPDLHNLPNDMLLSQNYPNPFNPETRILFQVPYSGKVTIKIFNMKGQIVATPVSSFYSPGAYPFKWHGRDDAGNIVSAGVYFYKMSLLHNSVLKTTSGTRKMVFLR